MVVSATRMLPVSSRGANHSKHRARVMMLTGGFRHLPDGSRVLPEELRPPPPPGWRPVHRRAAIVTDSSASLPPRLTEELGIAVAQIQVRIGDQVDEECRAPVPGLVGALRDRLDVTTAPPPAAPS